MRCALIVLLSAGLSPGIIASEDVRATIQADQADTSHPIELTFGLFFMGFADEPSRFTANHLISRAKTVEDFYRIAGRGKWATRAQAFEVATDFTRQQCDDQRAACPDLVCAEERTMCEVSFEANVREYIAENAIEFDYVTFVYALPNPSYCGEGPSHESFVWCDDEFTILHEIGHSVGLDHAGIIINERLGFIDEYGDTTTVMGSANRILFNSPEIVSLQLNDPETTLHVDRTRKVYLAPIEWKPESLRPGELQHAIVDKGSEVYFVSTRKSPGKFHVPASRSNLVWVHQVPDVNPAASILVGQLEAGQSWESAQARIRVSYRANRDGVAEVDLYRDVADPQPDGSEFPVSPREITPADPLRYGHAGSWYDPHTPGQGFDIDVLPERNEVLVYWYTYGLYGEPVRKKYFLGLGPIVDGVGKVDLFKTSGGQFDRAGNVSTEGAGTARLYFESCEGGYFEYDSPDLGRDTIYIRRLSPGEHCDQQPPPSPAGAGTGAALLQAGHSGSWYDPASDGQGMSMSFLETARQAILYWFTYGPGGSQDWFLAVGAFEPGTSSVELQLFRTTTGFFDTPEPDSTEPWGTVRIDVVDCERLDFSYALPDREPGFIPLVRLTPSLSCRDSP